MNLDEWLRKTRRLKGGILKHVNTMDYMDLRRSRLPPAGTYATKAGRRIRKQRKPREGYLKGLGLEDAQII